MKLILDTPPDGSFDDFKRGLTDEELKSLDLDDIDFGDTFDDSKGDLTDEELKLLDLDDADFGDTDAELDGKDPLDADFDTDGDFDFRGFIEGDNEEGDTEDGIIDDSEVGDLSRRRF